ncbi:hypothetical protein GQX74_005491, partial [Glossina fuscipes]
CSHTAEKAIPKEGRPFEDNAGSLNLVLRETNVALGLQRASGEWPELGVGKNPVGVNFIENEWEEVKSKVNRDEVGKVNNPGSSLISVSFQTANDNLHETNYVTELKDIKAQISIKSMESKLGKLETAVRK